MEKSRWVAMVLEGRVIATSNLREQDGGSTAGPHSYHH